jgi:hypothetical protein
MPQSTNGSRRLLVRLSLALVVYLVVLFGPAPWLTPDRFAAWAAGWQALGTIAALGLAGLALRQQARETQRAFALAKEESTNAQAGLNLAREQLDTQREGERRRYAENVSTWLELVPITRDIAAATQDDVRRTVNLSSETTPPSILLLRVTNRGNQPAFEACLDLRWDSATAPDQALVQRDIPVLPPTSQQEFRVEISGSTVVDAFIHHPQQLRVELTFRDVAGNWWKRTTNGLLKPLLPITQVGPGPARRARVGRRRGYITSTSPEDVAARRQ